MTKSAFHYLFNKKTADKLEKLAKYVSSKFKSSSKKKKIFKKLKGYIK